MKSVIHRLVRVPTALLACVLLSWASTAMAHEPHDSILQAATGFMATAARDAHGEGFDVTVTPGRLDPRLRLRRCDHGLEAFLGPGSRMAGSTTVGVRCPGPVTWTLYVPVNISVHGQVLVLTRPLPRGSLLEDAALRLERHDVGNLSGGYLSDLQEARHMVLRRALPAGTVLTPQMVEPPRLVQRGQRVMLVAENPAVTVRVAGEALADGSLGQRVQVRNLSSRRVVEGTVLSRGVVGVNM
ncbi:flagella basal body P-ring formation protein FlgA [Thioalkalivibrio denitrificans]|uniref:Flagella basal body P-ring formation protein FlgA n=1 Tax=Thioalkalivibrio denitrificans TaxID=108003 RepID=A0A1V3NPW1_9GAMM|nr:flagellar basal body P-ring formation chaperone FlgA [Thioalkalivibrio denitrificans]OOG27135.1 flagella basal body P-ring formation protein FlgA [Thioalkalivibrio denitrificans]